MYPRDHINHGKLTLHVVSNEWVVHLYFFFFLFLTVESDAQDWQCQLPLCHL
jgi:hypothetical protein